MQIKMSYWVSLIHQIWKFKHKKIIPGVKKDEENKFSCAEFKLLIVPGGSAVQF